MRSRQDRRWGVLCWLAAVLLVVGSACTGRAPTTAPRASGSGSRAPAAGSADAGGGLIYFWASHGYPAELWSMQPDGSHQRLIYKTQLWAKRPAPSPDGRRIAFDGAPQDMPLPSQSDEPQMIGDFDVQIVRVDGSGRRTLAGTPEREVDAQWSPDGGRLVLDAPTLGSDGDLLVVAAHGGRVLRRLTATSALEQAAAWSPDGSKILFTRYSLDSPWLAEVFVVNADGTGERRLTHAAGDDVAAAWSPDGRKIAFTSGRSGSRQIFVMNADGSDQRNLSRNSFDDEATSWQ
jgi:Tol biopolymer transport system component